MPNTQSPSKLASGGGLITKDAWQSLSKWLETVNAKDLSGWLAIYLELPQSMDSMKLLIADDTSLAVASRKIAEGKFTAEATIFLLHDGSTMAIFKNQSHLTMEAFQKDLENTVYENQTASKIVQYDLAIQLNELRMLCKRKQPSVISKIEPMTKPLDDKLLQTELFRQLAKARSKRGKLSILLVEDDKMVTHLLHRTLKQHDVVVAHNAADGLEMYSRTVPDICFMDIGLPDHSGIALLKVIHDNDPQAFIVMLTANSSEQNLHSSLSQGIKGFIAKPFTLSKISHYIETYENFRS